MKCTYSFIFLLVFLLTLSSVSAFDFANSNPNAAFGNFTWNGECLEGGVEIRSDGVICAQRLEIYNITSVNVTLQNVTVLENFIIEGALDLHGDLTFINAGIEDVNYVQFNTSWVNGQAEGRLQWNTPDGTLEVGMPGGEVNLQIGQENLIRATGKEGSQIDNGKVVYISGATGSFPDIKISSNDNATKARVVGVATEDISNNQKGYVTVFGLVRDINTSMVADGGIVWLGTNGDFTGTRPTSPTAQIAIGIVLRRHATEGILYVNPLILQQLSQLSDVYSVAKSNNSIVQWVASNSRFEMTTSPFFDNITVLGNIDMTNGSITNLWELVSTDGSRIATGRNPAYSMFSDLDSAEIFSNNQTTEEGVTTHALLSTDPGSERVIAAWQSGKNDSGQYTRNSGGYFPDLGLLNLSILTNIEEMWSRFGIIPLADYFSAQNKTSLAVLWAVESQKLFLHDDIGNGQLLGEGDFTWIARDGTDIDLFNGDGVHIKKDVIKEFGFSAGDNITSLNADFDTGTLLPFVQTTGGGIVDWSLVSNILCHEEECARALGGSGSPLRTMQANFSSIDQDNLNLSWWLTASQAPADIFTVDVNNNVGSGDVNVFSSSSVFVDEFQSVILPSSMNDKSTVTVIFSFQGNNINNDAAYVDEVLVVGNATTTTLANVTVEDATLAFGDKVCGIELSAEDGYQDLNITCDRINFEGNATFIDVNHITLNITDSVTVQNNVTLGSGATFWSNATCAFISSPNGGTVLEVCDP